MNYLQKNGTLFDTENSNIVPCRTTNPKPSKLADQPLYNPSGEQFINSKSKF